MLADLLAKLTPVKIVSIAAAVAAFGTGVFAAWKWLEASKVDVDLGYCLPGEPNPGTYVRMGMVLPRTPEPVDPILAQQNETVATWEAMLISSALNKVAALWTAVSVAFAAVSAIVGAFA